MKSGKRDTVMPPCTNLVKQAVNGSDMLHCGVLTIIGCAVLLYKSFTVFNYILQCVIIISLVYYIYCFVIGVRDMLIGNSKHLKQLNHIFRSSDDKLSKLARNITAKLSSSLCRPVSQRDVKVIIDHLEISTKQTVTQLKTYSQQDHYNDPVCSDNAIEKLPLQHLVPDSKCAEPLNDPLYSHYDLENDKSDIITLVKGDQAIEDHEQAAEEQSDCLIADSHKVWPRSLDTGSGSRLVLQKTTLVVPLPEVHDQCVEDGTDSIVRGDNPPCASEDSTEATTHSSSVSFSDDDSGSYVKNKPPDALPASASDHGTSLPSSGELQTISERLSSPSSLNSSKSRPLGIVERHLQTPQTSIALPTEESSQLDPMCKDHNSYTVSAPSSFEHHGQPTSSQCSP